MTKRDYERLASAARAIRAELRLEKAPLFAYPDPYSLIVDQLALACQDCAGTGGFDYARFRTACGLED